MGQQLGSCRARRQDALPARPHGPTPTTRRPASCSPRRSSSSATAPNGLWRNIYLRGAEELRGRIADPSPDLASPSVLGALTIEQLFDSIAIRVDPLRAAGESVCIDWVFTDLDRTYRTELSNGAFIHADSGSGGGDPTLTVTLTKAQMLGILAGHGLEGVQNDGDTAALGTLLGLIDSVDNSVAMVIP